MNSTTCYVILLLYVGSAYATIACRVSWLADQNGFLKNFVNHEFLGLLGVILAITLASIANIHLEFNKIEEKYQRKGLGKSRANLRANAFLLIGSFVVGVLIVTVKPIGDSGFTSQAIFNAAALFVLLLHIIVLINITQLIFSMGPDLPEGG